MTESTVWSFKAQISKKCKTVHKNSIQKHPHKSCKLNPFKRKIETMIRSSSNRDICMIYCQAGPQKDGYAVFVSPIQGVTR